LKGRPESLLRFPNGIGEEGFFQKNINDTFPKWVPSHVVTHDNRSIKYLLIPDEKTLLFAVNLGCIDFNPFNSRIQKLEYPDYVILDLDPENISFDAVVETAQVIHELLASHDIPCYCKTSGATGLHIYIPLGAKYTYEQTRQFGQMLATLAHEQLPEKTSIERSPSKRQKKVYIDYLQNNFGQTLASAYSVRPRPGAPVSTPLEWSEVKPGLDPVAFNMKNTLARLKKKGDLFKPVLGKGINLKAILKQF
jgi:bifunctional non-homologous end joining protein LigD